MNEEQGFIGEKPLLARLPISRRTLGYWKANGIAPYINIGRRCLYDWASVQGALSGPGGGDGGAVEFSIVWVDCRHSRRLRASDAPSDFSTSAPAESKN